MVNVSELVLGPDEKINFDALRDNMKMPPLDRNDSKSDWFVEQGVNEMLFEAEEIKMQCAECVE